jgi:hypothetical protein
MSYPAYPQSASSFRCQNHPDREGIGICVGCRSVVCVECSTKIDRMNYCIQCLQSASASGAERAEENPQRDAVLGIPLLIGAFLVAVVLFAVMGYVLALVRQWTGGGVTGA